MLIRGDPLINLIWLGRTTGVQANIWDSGQADLFRWPFTWGKKPVWFFLSQSTWKLLPVTTKGFRWNKQERPVDLPLRVSVSYHLGHVCFLADQWRMDFAGRFWPGTLIKKDVLKCTQACSDKVLADVGGEGCFLKSEVVFFLIY